jgi:hypothetical protein
MGAVAQELRLAVRTLARSPGFFAAATLTLILDIGANTAMFSIVYGVLERGFVFGVTVTDPLSFVAAPVLLVLIVLCAGPLVVLYASDFEAARATVAAHQGLHSPIRTATSWRSGGAETRRTIEHAAGLG